MTDQPAPGQVIDNPISLSPRADAVACSMFQAIVQAGFTVPEMMGTIVILAANVAVNFSPTLESAQENVEALKGDMLDAIEQGWPIAEQHRAKQDAEGATKQ